MLFELTDHMLSSSKNSSLTDKKLGAPLMKGPTVTNYCGTSLILYLSFVVASGFMYRARRASRVATPSDVLISG